MGQLHQIGLPLMSAANVQRTEDLTRLRASLARFAESAAADEATLALAIQRIATRFETDWPAYWRRQLKIAERSLRDAQLRLDEANRRTSGDQSPSTNHDAAAEVARAKQRRRLCHDRIEAARRYSINMNVEVEDFRRSLAALRELVSRQLPAAVESLDQTLAILERYRST